MEICCTRPGCPKPTNLFTDLDDVTTLKTVQQKYCFTCGMPQILIGRYLPSKLLGKGGFGAAFLARDRYTPTMRQCVVKQFQPSGDLSPDQLKVAQTLFEREAEVLEELGNQHPQIPNLYAFFSLTVPNPQSQQQTEFFYLVQEFIDGQDLEQELAQTGPFSEAQTQEILTEVLKILQFVHGNNSIHRDIKPSNIMRHRNGRLYLLDFGAVKQVAGSAAVGAKSTGIYSMGFAPPEQMAGGTVYPASDLYALAVTCITLLTGKDTAELYDAYSNSWDWRSHARVSTRFASILDAMLKTTPSQRPASAAEVLTALQSPTSRPASFTGSVTSNPSPLQGTGTKSTSLQTASSSSPKPIAAPSPKPIAKPSPPANRPAFSTIEFLNGAAFTGFEGGLFALTLGSLLGTSWITAGFWVILLGALIGLQFYRILADKDLPILAVITLIAAFILLRNSGLGIMIPLLGIFASLVLTAIAILFRLVYSILYKLL